MATSLRRIKAHAHMLRYDCGCKLPTMDAIQVHLGHRKRLEPTRIRPRRRSDSWNRLRIADRVCLGVRLAGA